MEKVRKITYMTAGYVFLSELRPFDAYRSAYLTGPDGNLSLSEVADVFESIKLYSVLFVGILMLITADYLLYKPNILFLTAWTGISYMLLTCSPSVAQLRVSAVGLGVIYSNNVLAYSYLYAQIEDSSRFQMATGVVTAADQLGKFVGDLMAQYIVKATGGRYTLLPYVTALSLFLAFIWATFFPAIKRKNQCSSKQIASNEKSWLLKKSAENIACYENKDEIGQSQNKRFVQVKAALKETWTNFKASYSNPILLKRCLWFVFGMAAYIEVLSNVNVLYSYVVERTRNQNDFYNGMAEAIVTLSGAIGAYIIGCVQLDWTNYSDSFTAFSSCLMGVLILSMYYSNYIYSIYVLYILFGFVYQAQFVVIYMEIAKHVQKQCYTAVLEFNVIGSEILVSIVTLCLIQFNFMNITIPGRFLFFGGCFVVLGVVFSLISIFEFFGKRKTSH